MKTDKENWEEMIEKEAEKHIACCGVRSCNDDFKAGVAFAQANLKHIPEVMKIIELARQIEGYAIHLQRCANRRNVNYKCDCGIIEIRAALQKLEG